MWSPLEYGAHVRDVIRLFTDRIAAMVTADEPEFAGWDQEAAALAARYNEQDPAIVAEERLADAQRLQRLLDSLDSDAWARRGSRDGRQFTVEYLVRYLLHDIAHHWHDIDQAR